jgi:hypothetical protein
MPNWHAITFTSNGGLLRVVEQQCHVSQAFDPAVATPRVWREFKGIWDTGASASVITQAVVDACALQPTGIMQLHAVNSSKTTESYLIEVRLPNGVTVRGVRAAKAEIFGADLLIGMDIITTGDFSITNVSGNTVFSFRIPSQRRIDYVRDHAAETLRESQTHGGAGKPRDRRPKQHGKKKSRSLNKQRG